MSGDVVTELVGELGEGAVVTSRAAMESYRRDATSTQPGAPLAVVRPRTTGEVQATMRWASRHGIAVVPRGAGTGLSGGSLAVDGAVTLSLDRMTAIVVDPDTRTAVVEPGALNADVKKAAAEHGLWYPPDPASFDLCSIGGNLATNAGGLCCVKYGVTADYVLGLDVVLADGALVALGGKRVKDVAGLPLLRLFVGSEGTLGIITGATLRLVPAPAPASTLVATFPDPVAAARTVVAVGRRLRPSMLELMDGSAINAVEDLRSFGLDRDAGALLLIRSDAPGTARTAEVAEVARICDEHGALTVFHTDDADEGELFAAARRAFAGAVDRRGTVLHEDVGVPVPRLPEVLAGIRDIAARHGLDIPVVAHAGDGNCHPLVVYDASDPDSVARAQAAFQAIMRLAISLGGTITGEHGVGRIKAQALPEQLGPDIMALTRRVKDALDPQGILNPGAVL